MRAPGEVRPEPTGETPATVAKEPEQSLALVPFTPRPSKRTLFDKESGRELTRDEDELEYELQQAEQSRQLRARPAGRDDFRSTSVSAADSAQRTEDSFNVFNPLAASTADDSLALTTVLPAGLTVREDALRAFAAPAPGYETKLYRKGALAERVREDLGSTGAAYTRTGQPLHELGEVVNPTKVRLQGAGWAYTPEEWGDYFSSGVDADAEDGDYKDAK